MGAFNGKFVKISYKMSEMEKRNTNNNNDNLGEGGDDCDDSKSNISGNGNENNSPSASTSSSWRCSSNASSSSGENNNVTCNSKGGCSNSSAEKKVTKKKKHLLKSSSSGSAGTSSSLANTIASKKENFFSKRNKKWPMRSASSKKEQETESKKSSSCICTSYRRTNSDSEASLNPRKNTVPFHHGPIIDLSKFNPNHYPIEDEDERQRQLRAKEIQEGVELSAVLFGNLKLKERDESSGSGTNSFPSIHTQVDYIHCLVPDLKEISNCSFYHGKIDRYAAEALLDGKPEGTFLLRDSAQEDFLFSVSFRRYGRSLHARIEQWNHKFSFDSHDPSVFCSQTVTGLIHHYKEPSVCMFFEPMLTVPLHRKDPFNLQHLARSVISSNITYDDINLLPIPKKLKTYLKEYHYKQRVCIRRLD